MEIKELEIKDLILITPHMYEDDRGFFYESFNAKKFADVVGKKINFIQDNHSFSHQNTLRGIHYQKKPYEQGKLVRVIDGEVYDVAVDLRENSPTYGRWAGVNLSSKNNRQLWIPEGFGHGFYVLSKTVHFLYKTTAYYNPSSEFSIRWDDPDLSINWPLNNKPSVSEKDNIANTFKEFANK